MDFIIEYFDFLIVVLVLGGPFVVFFFIAFILQRDVKKWDKKSKHKSYKRKYNSSK